MDDSTSPRTTWSSFARSRSASMSTFASLTGTMPPLHPSSSSSPPPHPSALSQTSTPTATPTSSLLPQLSATSAAIADPRTHLSPARPPLHTPRRPSAPQIDLRALELLAPCDPNLLCPICAAPFVEPVTLPCEHVFCRACVAQAWAVQAGGSGGTSSCPHCRARVLPQRRGGGMGGGGEAGGEGEGQAERKTSRILVTMVEELRVRCPRWEGGEGCGVVMARGDVRDHVERYCGWTEVDCPVEGCEGWVWRRDVGAGCTHFGTACEDCGEEMMQRDLPVHRDKTCQKCTTTCPDCGEEVLRKDLEGHSSNDCLEIIQPCLGASYGCKSTGKRRELQRHQENCIIAALQPFLEAQTKRQDELQAANDLLQRKISILEGGLSSVEDMLYSTPTTSTAQDRQHTSNGNSNQSLSATSVETDGQGDHGDESSLQSTASDPTAPLLSLVESLREDIARVSASVADLDSRHSMMITNDGLRAREDMAHANAAINGLRVQLHWLVSARMQQQRQMLQQQGAGGASSTSAAGPSTGPGVVRRLSDSVRQETKL
ncbi:MAG: hypothetical protein M1822_003915 [Bathelium mastoideum]|nr:MAG: hypothetical protein M1822_003915 [Bathelium mastoideum]